VPSAKEFHLVAEVLLGHVPDGTDISAIRLTFSDGHWRVCLQTRTPGRVIGRRGATADAIRAALAEQLDDSRLQVNIEEAGGPGAPPPGPPTGDREPRKPRPAAPTTALAMEEPNQS
jgi:predicted RNA-binding protein YlqC (UPF0109 family)